jgi:hypothetical protein
MSENSLEMQLFQLIKTLIEFLIEFLLPLLSFRNAMLLLMLPSKTNTGLS